ncbi:SDR family NAD(P)-dependent oxidoreductase [Alteromonas sp. a30]|uniref:SDR family NAD(P)-dependent oxidoreductase n=1 Tax=Alteromonas sp. a30 TaxID=2730917 RepID=UPI00227F2A9E|nr:SDR family oxidoreductase [Alteromonas sp. a30]MCY7296216.1 SDR family oxidoreductase [Alteromonas sp. a30]
MAEVERGKLALVTGSTSGIGFGIAKALLENGYHVLLNGRDNTKAQQALKALAEYADRITLVIADTTTEQGVQTIQSAVQALAKPLDVLVTNVGSGRAANDICVGAAAYRQMFDINFYSAVNVCEALLPYLARPSAIICISSIAGVAPIGAPIPYACAKSALNMFVKEWAVRLAEQKIRINSLSPGNVMFEGSVWHKKYQENTEKTQTYIQNNVPLNDFVTPQELGEMVLQMATSPMLTGQNIVIDGGQSRGMS